VPRTGARPDFANRLDQIMGEEPYTENPQHPADAVFRVWVTTSTNHSEASLLRTRGRGRVSVKRLSRFRALPTLCKRRRTNDAGGDCQVLERGRESLRFPKVSRREAEID